MNAGWAYAGDLPVQIRGANILGFPVITTEQYPKALGHTVTELAEVLSPQSPVIAKTRFSMLTPEVHELLKQKSSISQVCVCGVFGGGAGWPLPCLPVGRLSC
jgi:hypothetical protein